ncbi:MAG: hypothetical protein ACO3D6_06010 [Candidatus Nanopelagicaceae bacterium]
MDDLIDMMISNESPADISDRIKEILMAKSAENIEIIRPVVAASMFGEPETEEESDEVSYEDESEDYEEDAE